MRIGSGDDGAVVELVPAGYQFGAAAGPPGDWDANWLVIHGRVWTEDVRSWSFRDACLTTWEADELGAWLRAVAAGQVEPVAFTGADDEPRLLTFTEPGLALSLAERTPDRLTLRIHFSLECSPPWGDDNLGLFEYAVLLSCTPAALTGAAARWHDELRPFPER